MAVLPDYSGVVQSLESVILPFCEGECFACTAETFGFAFSRPWSANLTGEISAENNKEVAHIMEKAGFGLMRTKGERSF